jgi:hypothetical protein
MSLTFTQLWAKRAVRLKNPAPSSEASEAPPPVKTAWMPAGGKGNGSVLPACSKLAPNDGVKMAAYQR